MLKTVLEVVSLWTIPLILVLILLAALVKRLPVYEIFVDGAKEGVKVGVNIFPYLLAMLVAIGMFRASGAIDILGNWLEGVLTFLNVPVETLPIMIVRSLSGGATLGVFSDIAANNDINSYLVKLSAIMVGSSETTFYVLAVYFGAVGIKKFRYALITGIFADVIGIVAAIFVSRIFFL